MHTYSLDTVGNYRIIYADPAWKYRDRASAGRRGAGFKYRVSSLEEMADLPVVSIAGRDCALFMWATCPMLPEALKLMRAWGFEYKTVAFVWVKSTKRSGADFFGMGNWTRANAELVLLGVRGRPRRLNASVRQVVRSPIRRHSEKPPEVRDAIVRLLGDLPRIELFARQSARGWDSWGDEAPGK